MNTKIVNIYRDKYDVYIGRPGKGQDGYFGNPFSGDRVESIKLYKEYFYNRIKTDKDFKEKIDSLKGKVLGCFCFPKLCHGMVIIEYLDGISVDEQFKTANHIEDIFDDISG